MKAILNDAFALETATVATIITENDLIKGDAAFRGLDATMVWSLTAFAALDFVHKYGSDFDWECHTENGGEDYESAITTHVTKWIDENHKQFKK